MFSSYTSASTESRTLKAWMFTRGISYYNISNNELWPIDATYKSFHPEKDISPHSMYRKKLQNGTLEK